MKNKLFANVVAALAIILNVALPRNSAQAYVGSELPVFSDFVHTVMNGRSEVIRGVYAPGVMAFPVVQQPQNNPSAVSENASEVTQFGPAASNKVIGLLAHNTLAGASFSNLSIGQEVRIIYGNARVQYFVVDHLYRFQVIQPEGPNTSYLDLGTRKTYSTQQIFRWFYAGKIHLALQTCIQLDGNSSWGRLFITATPIPPTFFSHLKALNLPELQNSLAIIKSLRLVDGYRLPR
jgi:hypothetical protein